MQKTSHAAAAAAIRAELKANNIKASVRSRSFAGGNAVDVEILQDVLPATLKEIEAFVGRFQYGHFDGMTDSYSYTNRDESLPQVKYTHVRVTYSAAAWLAAEAFVASCTPEGYQRENLAYRALNGTWGDFWTARKPRRRFDHAAQQVAA
jgi:hypothetical protein